MEPNNQPQNQPTPPQKPSKGYGKRPVWQWVLIYVVAAVIIYGLIYLVFIRNGSSTGTSGY
jgi:hypothetical protein